MRRCFAWVLLFALLPAISACPPPAAPPAPREATRDQAPEADTAVLAARNPRWAEPISASGLPNFFRVSDDLYRGAQPTAAGFRELKRRGIRTVISLRQLHSDGELLAGTGLQSISIPMNAAAPRVGEYRQFLAAVRDPANLPVFVHCQHGADRTGTAVALYRIVVQGWDREEAIREMGEGGYGHHGIFGMLPGFIRDFPIER